MPFRWIEQAEARTVLATMWFDQAPPPPAWHATVRDVAADWLGRAAEWFALAGADWPMLQAQPALVRRPVYGRNRRDDDGGLC
jgi:hypothetical protein